MWVLGSKLGPQNSSSYLQRDLPCIPLLLRWSVKQMAPGPRITVALGTGLRDESLDSGEKQQLAFLVGLLQKGLNTAWDPAGTAARSRNCHSTDIQCWVVLGLTAPKHLHFSFAIVSQDAFIYTQYIIKRGRVFFGSTLAIWAVLLPSHDPARSSAVVKGPIAWNDPSLPISWKSLQGMTHKHYPNTQTAPTGFLLNHLPVNT